ncbi:MAG: extracellular solute-binding protein [Zavarzinella sp.]
MPRLNRRSFLGNVAGLAGSTLAGCSSSQSTTQELRIFCYAGGHEQQLRAVFLPEFERQTGAKATLYPGWWDGIPKLKAAPESDPPFDLMVSDATQGYPAVREGLFAALDFNNIPNVNKQAKATLKNWVIENGYGLTYPDSVMTLAYHRKMVKTPPTRWADLLTIADENQLGLYQSFYLSLYTFAAMLADTENQAGQAANWINTRTDEVFRFARQHRERVKLWWPTTTDMILALNNRQCTAGNMHSPEYYTALKEKPELGATVPEKDRAFVQVFWSIPVGSRNRQLAEQAINIMFSDDVQLGLAKYGSATANLNVASKMAESDPFWKSLYPHTEEQFQSLQYYPYDYYAAHWDELANEWERTVLRKS